MIAEKAKSRAFARLCTLALALAALAPRAGFAYDDVHYGEKSRLRLQKEEEIRKMEEREEEARRRIAENRRKGDAELSEIGEILKEGRTAVDSATERAKSVLEKTGEPLPPELRKFGRQCKERISALEKSAAECEAKLHSSDFVSEIVVASTGTLKREAAQALADARRLSESLAQFEAAIADPGKNRTEEDRPGRSAWRGKRRVAAVAVPAAVLALAALAAVAVSKKRKKQPAATVSRGPLRRVHSVTE